VAGGHATVPFEPVDPALHRMPLLVDLGVEGRGRGHKEVKASDAITSNGG
jgi:hypothetical protein